MSETVQSPDLRGKWHRDRLTIVTELGPSIVDSFALPLVPGIAVTLGDSLCFSVTHVESGRRFGPRSVMAARCMAFVVEYALICRELNVSPADPAAFKMAVTGAFKERRVPFGGFTTTVGGETTAGSIYDWWCVEMGPETDLQFIEVDAVYDRLDAAMELLTTPAHADEFKEMG